MLFLDIYFDELMKLAEQRYCYLDTIAEEIDRQRKVPFQRNTAEAKIKENNLKHPDIFTAISILPNTTLKAFSQVDDDDMRYNLTQQLIAMCLKRQQQ